jgi:hypothetical protein
MGPDAPRRPRALPAPVRRPDRTPRRGACPDRDDQPGQVDQHLAHDRGRRLGRVRPLHGGMGDQDRGIDARPVNPSAGQHPLHRPDPARAGRRRRRDRAMELPADDRPLEDRAGACLRLHHGPQAVRGNPAHGAPDRRTGTRGGPSQRDPQCGHRPGIDGRSGPDPASTRSPSPARPRPASRLVQQHWPT